MLDNFKIQLPKRYIPTVFLALCTQDFDLHQYSMLIYTIRHTLLVVSHIHHQAIPFGSLPQTTHRARNPHTQRDHRRTSGKACARAVWYYIYIHRYRYDESCSGSAKRFGLLNGIYVERESPFRDGWKKGGWLVVFNDQKHEVWKLLAMSHRMFGFSTRVCDKEVRWNSVEWIILYMLHFSIWKCLLI